MAPTPQPGLDAAAIRRLRRALLGWYDLHRRELPWRPLPGEPVSAYEVWISEVMLQQTRASVVEDYYRRFLVRFPNLPTLARAPLDVVLALWSGLGYYRRARQLHAAAAAVVARHGGALPLERAALLALPGIGAYTAAAILSIAAGQPEPAVDGNLLRVAERLLGRSLSPARARGEMQHWIAPRRPGDFNQALMDLGATVCLPRAPHCHACPLRRLCRTRGARPARRRPAAISVEEHYVLARRAGRVWLRQRPSDAARMPGLWELPRVEKPEATALAHVRHAITRYAIQAHLHAGRALAPGRWVTPAELASLPLTGLCRKLLAAAER